MYWNTSGHIIAVFDEGYRRSAWVSGGTPTAKDLEASGVCVRQGGAVLQITPVEIPVSEYRSTIEYAKRISAYHPS